MSYGSTFIQFEANGRMSQKFSRPHLKKEDVHERPSKVVDYGKEFDVKLSRVDHQPVDKTSVKDSMLSYSKKMRSLQEARNTSEHSKAGPLFVRAKHIPKYPTRLPKKRRPMSFDELLGRDRDSIRDIAVKPRPLSDKTKPKTDGETNEIHLPLLSERLRKSGASVQVSLVSASDLYEIVDLSIRSNEPRHERLQMLKMEADEKHHNEAARAYERLFPESYSHFERAEKSKLNKLQRIRQVQKLYDNNLDDTHIPSEEFYEEIFSMEKAGQREGKLEPFKRRPHRAKRMKLIDPGLGDIPEDNVIETLNSQYDYYRDARGVTSPPIPKTPSKPQNALTKIPLDCIEESVEKVSFKDNLNLHSSGKHTIGLNASPRVSSCDDIRGDHRAPLPGIGDAKSMKKVIRDDGDVRIEVTQCPPKHESLGTKLKAQKRFKKLIFLRDTPR